MKDLRLTGHETGVLHFESAEGEMYRVQIDDSLSSAIKAATTETANSATISPREIQERIRAGVSVEQLAAESGAPVSYILKFAQTVFDELQHMVDSALAIRITIAGDRFNDEVQAEFGQIIESRLFAGGARNVRWSSKRQEIGSWLLTAQYDLGENTGVATWIFEPRKFHLAPENEAAITLSNHDSGLDGPIPKLRTVIANPPAAPSVEAPLLTPVISVVNNKAQEESADLPAAFRKPENTETTDLLAQLRKKREEASAPSTETKSPEPDSLDSGITQFPETEPKVEEPPVESQETPSEPVETNEPKESPKRSRATMPSWDEIVFGTKSED